MRMRRVNKMMKRIGVEQLPLSHCGSLQDFNSEVSKLSDAQLLDAWSRTLGFAATRVTDEELLRQIDEALHEDNKERTL
jgi:hypothetical protein